MDFKLINAYSRGMPMKTLAKASATVIKPGSMVTLTSGLATVGAANSASLAYCPNGGANGEVTIQVLNDPNAEFYGTAATNFAVTNRAGEVDMVVTGGIQYINLAASVTDVFKVSIGTDAGVVGAATNVKVKINKFLY